MRTLNSVTGNGGLSPDVVEPIAVIGLATRFPQEATTTEALWELLLQARSTWSTIPKERFVADAFFHPDPEHGGTFHVQGGHFLSEDPAYFDGSFFNITKNELMTLDPQQRLVLENVYHALENSGIPIATAAGSNTSVFVSGFNHDYLGILNSDPETALKYKPTGVVNAILSNRVSWFFDFKGPSMTIDTACSSSLVALHLAVQSLRARETNMALVSGVSILENPVETVGMSHHGLLGTQGRCFSFDSRAEGYARGEGVGTVVLKPLSTAIRDGDTIRAVIRETGVNQDGRTSGLTVPSAEAQEKLIREVYWRAGLDLEQTRFVEAHGTGTSIGDPIEAGALARAFKCRRETPLYVGTIKSTIGHLEGGSGVASLIKSILILESGVIPPNLDIQEINDKIPAAEWNIAFPKEITPWPSEGLRRISVNSFGIGGTNAHCVLDDAHHYLQSRLLDAKHRTHATVPKTFCLSLSRADAELDSIPDSTEENNGGVILFGTPGTSIADGSCLSTELGQINPYLTLQDAPKIFLLSAFDEGGIKRAADTYSHYLGRKIDQPRDTEHLLEDLSFTLTKRRSVFPWKSFVSASTLKELSWNLTEGNFSNPVRSLNAPEIHFVFTGQGAQYEGMGKALLVYPVFQKSLEEASEYIRRLGSPWSLIDELLAEGTLSSVGLPEIAHPLCTALQVALVDLLASWDIYPTSVTGHSSGEIAAAYSARILSRQGAWTAAYYRGYVSSKQLAANGAMMAVGLSASKLEPYLEWVHKELPGELLIACYNSPKNNTVSGDEALVDCLKLRLDNDGVFVRKLNVQNAYHSAHMRFIAEEYLQLMGDLSFGERLAVPHSVHMFSTVTGKEIVSESLTAQYWVDNMVSPVRFTSGLNAMRSRAIEISSGSDLPEALPFLVEIGPHSTLQSAIKETLASQSTHSDHKYFSVLKRSDPSLNPLLSIVGLLAANGYQLDLHKVNLASCIYFDRPARLLIDLPPYSFKHTEKNSYESRLSRNLRTRKFPRHDLFGAPVSDWDSNAPRWRHFIRLNENPWLRDHMVTENVVYPGVGFLVMAIEASRQLAGEKEITGFQLRNISINRALVVPDTKEGIEISLSMTPTDRPSDLSTWRRFQISSFNESSDEWTEHCNGYVAVQSKPSSDLIDNGRQASAEVQAWKQEFETAQALCTKPITFGKTYDNLREIGLHFGPLFRNLNNVQDSGCRLGLMTGVVTVPEIAQSMPKQYMHSHLIHPATMDSMIHMMIAASIDLSGKPALNHIRLPTYIRDMWVSSDLSAAPLNDFFGHATVVNGASDKLQGHIRIMGAGGQPRIRIDGIELTRLESTSIENDERKLCSAVDWKPDVYFLESTTANELSSISEINTEANRYWVERLQMATMLYVTDALVDLNGLDITKLDSHMRKFHDWMIHWQKMLVNDQIIHLPYSEFQRVSLDSLLKQTIYKEIESHSAEGEITARMGRNIAAVVRKEVDPLNLMFGQDKVMEGVYKEGLHLYNLPKHLKSHLSLLRHQHSGLNILEIGGGTGSFTAEVFSVLAPEEDATRANISTYTFTDISPGFFEKAKCRFQAWGDIMSFQPLNIEKSPFDQGFEEGSFDLIFAGNVIHATKNLNIALRNLRSLLRPGGQLIMQEGIRQDFLWYPLVFGQLPGWWLGDEPIRQWCPYIPTSEWNTLLNDSGFSGVDIEYPSSTEDDLTWQSILISTAHLVETQARPSVFVLTLRTAGEDPVVPHLQIILEGTFPNVSFIRPSELDSVSGPNTLCISLVDLQTSFLSHVNETEYIAVRRLLTECENIFWVTPNPRDKPLSNTSLGLLRTVRWERNSDGSNIVTLAVSEDSLDGLAECIHRIAIHQFVEKNARERHAEYFFQNNIIHIGRLREWNEADNFLALPSSGPNPELVQLDDVIRPIELKFAEHGSETRQLYWAQDHQHDQCLGPSEVEVEIRAIGLTSEFDSALTSNEASGVVRNVGPAVKGVIPGDHVVLTASGESSHLFKTLARIDQLCVVKVPENVPLEIAAGLPSIYATAIYGLKEVVRLRENSSILIHNGAAALGQAVLQYARLLGAFIYTTVSTVEERDLIISEYGIPPECIFSNRDLGFSKAVMRTTNAVGVNVVFNTLTGEAMQESLACVAPFGHFIHVSNKNALVETVIDLAAMQKCVTVTNVDIELLMTDRPELIGQLIGDALKLYAEGKINQVQPFTVMSFAQITDGVQTLQGNEVKGKNVFAPKLSDKISLLPDLVEPYQLDGQASYLLAGGLGGLGRSLALWMASRGAKHLIFLSRSGRITDPVKEMIASLQGLGCQPHIFTCDVSDAERLRQVIEECSASLPPIKGCIQGSMVLRDGAFANMSFEDWQTAIRPKVQGSWNLHETLPVDLDFFVMLSSVAGIFGNRGQSNYAAGNTFQDALAAYRTERGMNASSINLGSVSSVGWVAENRGSMRMNTDTLFEFLHEEEVHRAVEFLIDHRYKKDTALGLYSPSQLVLGLPTAEMCRKNNISTPSYIDFPLFTHMRAANQTKSIEVSDQKTVSIATRLSATSNSNEAVDLISDGIVERLSSLLAIPSSEIDAQRFSFSGIDSLASMEFVSWIVKSLKAEVSLLDIMGARNIRALSEKIEHTRLTSYAK
ncbi:Acyl transferase/acyl hydrolase/lysophospholipase [Penicillium frequentans]|uniref:Acyl transferase/acyl hydrolase/lysophospholipase n=1 Tax=Penicillium frequentans TaxID=3151616 RepID=A0AAD6D0S0_9EURO|nr:Acyl transferase/acyl hydrolase/lysophospholipase [Penicillium glabrum]